MRSYASVLALGAAASLVAAQATPPACFLSCYQSVGASSSCGLTEVACLCADQAFIGGVTSCLQSTCTSASDIAAGGTYAVQTCSAAGVTVDTSALATASEPFPLPLSFSTPSPSLYTLPTVLCRCDCAAAGSSASASGSATSSIASALSSVASGASASASSASSALSSLSSQLSSAASSATGSAPSATASGDSDASTLKKGGALAGVAALAAVLAL
ncbi:hypothetical protein JCM11641_006308 [Rhodosporidiobolus odoratus]